MRDKRAGTRRTVSIEELREEQTQSRIDVSVEIVADNYVTKRRRASIASMQEMDDCANDRSRSNI